VSTLVVDVGTSGVRAAVVTPGGSIEHLSYVPVPAATPMQGFVEVDAGRVGDAVLEVARRSLTEGGPVEAVGIANQRATTIVWERATGEPVAPGIGWQDLRTVGLCLSLQSEGIRLLPSASATKLVAILDAVDPGRSRDLCFGTVDSWIAWTLSGGHLHVTDTTNAAVTGLVDDDLSWSPKLLDALRIPAGFMPSIVSSSGIAGEARALEGSPPIAGIAGDQQASLVGQGCTRAGLAKATFGTGGMLDLCTGGRRPPVQAENGTFPIVAWTRGDTVTWGVEAMMLTAGAAVDWLREDLGLITTAGESEALAAASPEGDVWFVPALLGLGTPVWDFGARGTLLGLTRGTGRAEIARAVLEGIAHRGADLAEAAEADSGLRIESLRVDGGMSANAFFLQALADATQRRIEVSPVLEATTLGAAYLAGLAVGTWSSEEEIASSWSPRAIVEPSGRPARRERWLEARERAKDTVPELSSLRF
jgi:glycerol kinase